MNFLLIFEYLYYFKFMLIIDLKYMVLGKICKKKNPLGKNDTLFNFYSYVVILTVDGVGFFLFYSFFLSNLSLKKGSSRMLKCARSSC